MRYAPALEDLNLDVIGKFRDKSTVSLSQYPKLTKLSIHSNEFTEVGAVALSENKTIKHLNMPFSNIGLIGGGGSCIS